MRLRFTAVAIALTTSSPLAAEPQKTIAPNTNVGDPNERICENLIVTGSRLATRRFCGTRAEWADRKRQDREALERAQASPCVVSGTSGTGRASC
jgi:hypothetical protein